jgi:hypothetical protein
VVISCVGWAREGSECDQVYAALLCCACEVLLLLRRFMCTLEQRNDGMTTKALLLNTPELFVMYAASLLAC